MMKKLEHKFVEFIPDKIEPGVLYISTQYKTAIHLCACGCGSEVATPLSPYDWRLTFDGESVSLYPSIGNWSLPCQSHYLITNGEVEWAQKWSPERIEQGRRENRKNKEKFYKGKGSRSFWNLFG